MKGDKWLKIKAKYKLFWIIRLFTFINGYIDWDKKKVVIIFGKIIYQTACYPTF